MLSFDNIGLMNEDASRGKDRILASALRLFANVGFDRASTRDIGLAAGVSSPALYRHYASKEALGLDLYRRCYVRMLEAVEAEAERHQRFSTRLIAYMDATAALFETDPQVVMYVDEHQARFWPSVRSEFGSRTLSSIVLDWVERARSAGELNADVDAVAQAALVLGLASQWFAMRGVGLVEMDALPGFKKVLAQALLSSNVAVES